MSADPHEPAVKIPCPVCGHPGLWQRPYANFPPPPYPDFGDPPYHPRFGPYSHEGCHSCGYQFGYDDDAGACGTPTSFHDYRAAWVADGCQWFHGDDPRPAGWSVRAQLAAAGIAFPENRHSR